MTAEVSFAQAFLTTLESRPVKIPADYAVDQKTFEPRGPYTLPRMPQPMKRPSKTSAPGAAPAVTVSLKSLRNPPLDMSLPAQPLTASVLELKQKVAAELGIDGTDKIRLLYKKKPCTDSKSIKDAIGDGTGTTVEFSVMVMGGVPEKSIPKEDVIMENGPVAQGESGHSVMQAPVFWTDLEAFLEQRVRDQQVAQKAAKLFEQVWKEKGQQS